MFWFLNNLLPKPPISIKIEMDWYINSLPNLNFWDTVSGIIYIEAISTLRISDLIIDFYILRSPYPKPFPVEYDKSKILLSNYILKKWEIKQINFSYILPSDNIKHMNDTEKNAQKKEILNDIASWKCFLQANIDTYQSNKIYLKIL